MSRYDFKICNVCKVSKPFVDFYRAIRNKDGYTNYCKECSRDRMIKADLQTRTRKIVIESLGGKCVECGFNDYRALQIDHINGGGCQHRRRVSWYKRYREVIEHNDGKYQLLCANCNQIKKRENKEYNPRGKHSAI